MGKTKFDNYQTPKEAVGALFDYIDKNWIVWECACGKRNIVNALDKAGYNVNGTDIMQGFDFLKWKPRVFDCIITNPPYSKKNEFLKRCYQLKKPFALLMPLTALESKIRQKMYKKHGMQLLVPDTRYNFETPHGRGTGPWFCTAWYTNGLHLPKDLLFYEVKK